MSEAAERTRNLIACEDVCKCVCVSVCAHVHMCVSTATCVYTFLHMLQFVRAGVHEPEKRTGGRVGSPGGILE